MAIGAQNRQNMNPAQFVTAANEGRLVEPKNYSSPNSNPQLFNPGASVPLVQEAMQDQTRQNNALDAVNEARPFGLLNQVLSSLDKAQPNIEALKYEKAMRTNALLNQELGTINSLYEKAYKGDMEAQSQLTNFTFRPEILEGASVEQYSALRDQLNKAQLSVANSTVIAASQAVKKDLAERVQKLTGEGNEDAMALASLIGSVLVRSGTSAIPQDQIENIKDRISFYRVKYPKSTAIQSNIVDQYKEAINNADRSRMEEAEYGSGKMSIRDASSMIGNISRMLQSNPNMSDETRAVYEEAGTNALQRSGFSRGAGMTPPVSKPGEPSAMDKLNSFFNTPSK